MHIRIMKLAASSSFKDDPSRSFKHQINRRGSWLDCGTVVHVRLEQAIINAVAVSISNSISSSSLPAWQVSFSLFL